MKQILITTIAAVLLVGCGPSVDIYQAAKVGNIKAVKQHLEAGVNVNVKADNGNTPLHNAAYYGHKEVAKLLIDKGAEVNAITKLGRFEGRTPLDFAIAQNSTKNTDLLRKLGGKTAKELKSEGK